MNDHDEDRVKGGFMLKYENIEIKIERYCVFVKTFQKQLKLRQKGLN